MSKGLEVWLDLAEWFVDYYNRVEKAELDKHYFTDDKWGVEINGIPTSTITKELEVFDIIKSKNVNCFKLKFCKDLEDYNLNLVGLVNFKTNELEGEIGLTQEEFDLLKVVLGNE